MHTMFNKVISLLSTFDMLSKWSLFLKSRDNRKNSLKNMLSYNIILKDINQSSKLNNKIILINNLTLSNVVFFFNCYQKNSKWREKTILIYGQNIYF